MKTREDLVRSAREYVGCSVRETPETIRSFWKAVQDSRTDSVRAADNFWSWCAAFVSAMFANIGEPFQHEHGGGIAFVPYLIEHARSVGAFRDPADFPAGPWYEPDPGDLIFFQENKSRPDHVGIVEEFDEYTRQITTIEGNLSGAVGRRTWNLGDGRIVGFGVFLNE